MYVVSVYKVEIDDVICAVWIGSISKTFPRTIYVIFCSIPFSFVVGTFLLALLYRIELWCCSDSHNPFDLSARKRRFRVRVGFVTDGTAAAAAAAEGGLTQKPEEKSEASTLSF